MLWLWRHVQGMVRQAFLTSAAEKAKTQAENSSQKLKEKTQPQGGTLFILRKTQEKNSILPIFLLKLKIFMGCHFFFCYFYEQKISNSTNFQLFFTKNIESFIKLKKNRGEKT